MFLNNNMGKTMDLLHRAMGASIMRHEVLANNMANINTDHFKRSDITFESALKKALDSEKPPKFPIHRPDHVKPVFARHRIDYRTVIPKKTLDFETSSKSNGNNVDPDVEASRVLHNILNYQLMTQAVSSHFNQVSLVLRG